MSRAIGWAVFCVASFGVGWATAALVDGPLKASVPASSVRPPVRDTRPTLDEVYDRLAPHRLWMVETDRGQRWVVARSAHDAQEQLRAVGPQAVNLAALLRATLDSSRAR